MKSQLLFAIFFKRQADLWSGTGDWRESDVNVFGRGLLDPEIPMTSLTVSYRVV
jgi:hypothetical protein